MKTSSSSHRMILPPERTGTLVTDPERSFAVVAFQRLAMNSQKNEQLAGDNSKHVHSQERQRMQ
jgi:hypothetical protein